MELGVTVDRHQTQAGLCILAQSGMPAQTPAQRCLSVIWLSTFTCG
jgi:hypothetical protein